MSRATNIGRRCSFGCETWPDLERFSICPRCGEGTRRYRGVKPLQKTEAESVARHCEFEWFYENEWVADNEPLSENELQALGIDTS